MKYDIEKLKKLAISMGFSNAGLLNMEALVFLPEVRQMCNSDSCRSFNKNWMCPPAIGTLEQSADKVKEYSFGMIVQTTAFMDDEFDYETIRETQKKHNNSFLELATILRKEYPSVLPMGAGACSVCNQCTYPDKPCRFPDKAIGSMESYGLWVSKVCEKSSIDYYYGKNTLTFTSCFLLK